MASEKIDWSKFGRYVGTPVSKKEWFEERISHIDDEIRAHKQWKKNVMKLFKELCEENKEHETAYYVGCPPGWKPPPRSVK